MRSAVADEMRARVRERMLRMTPSERAELALRLGDEVVASYAATQRVSVAEARRTLRANAERLRPRPFPSRRPPGVG